MSDIYEIFYRKDGVITGARLEAARPDGDGRRRHIVVPAGELPKDFASTFALGKYRVEKKKLVKVAAFRRPQRRKLLELLPEEIREAVAPEKPKRRRKQSRK